MEGARTVGELSTALERQFTIDDYLELRERFPEADTALWMVMGADRGTPPLDWILRFN